MLSKILILGWITLVLHCSKTCGTELDNDPAYSLQILGKALRGICWYEAVKRIPPPVDHMEFDHCIQYANLPERNFIEHPDKPDWDYLLSDGLHGSVMGYSNEYSACTEYWKNQDASMDKEYYQNLDDKEEYKLKSLAHCLLHALEDGHGSRAINDVAVHWNEPTSFLMAMWNRENELRAHHGVPKLLLDSELTKQAQLIADDMADAGKDFISSKYQGSPYPTAENQSGFVGQSAEQLEWAWGIPVTVDMVGAVVANKWYLENDQYPWPAFDGTNGDLKSFARFTQQVWNGTKRVGYGYVLQRGPPEIVYVVARYWPAGNPTEEESFHLFEKNVFPNDVSTPSK